MDTTPRDCGHQRTPIEEVALQDELRREAGEHARLGDVEANRNLSGSSSWSTLPEPAPDAGDAPKKRRGCA